jgi:hypothetical protein
MLALLDQRMAQNLILLPVFVQVMLTVSVLIVLGARRRRSMARRGQKVDDMALARDVDWEKPALLASNNFKNQFELPVLFYAGAAFALATRSVDMGLFLLACVFALTRIGHTAVHLANGRVTWRGIFYLIGLVALVAFWITLAVRVLGREF